MRRGLKTLLSWAAFWTASKVSSVTMAGTGISTHSSRGRRAWWLRPMEGSYLSMGVPEQPPTYASLRSRRHMVANGHIGFPLVRRCPRQPGRGQGFGRKNHPRSRQKSGSPPPPLGRARPGGQALGTPRHAPVAIGDLAGQDFASTGAVERAAPLPLGELRFFVLGNYRLHLHEQARFGVVVDGGRVGEPDGDAEAGELVEDQHLVGEGPGQPVR